MLQVESEYYERVHTRCQSEKITQHRLHAWGNRKQAAAMAMPACEELSALTQRLNANVVRPGIRA
jgi:hypothetical protein